MDLLPYFLGNRVYTLSTGERFWVEQPSGSRWFYHVKNNQYEQLFYDDGIIGRGVDTSPGNNRVYIQLRAEQLASNTIGAAWLKRDMDVGETFMRRPFVYWRTKDNRPADRNAWIETPIRFVRRHESYRFQSGMTIPDVIELKWDVPGGETYFYARGYGLVGWVGDNLVSFITGVIDNGFALPRERIAWVDQLIPAQAPVLTPVKPPPASSNWTKSIVGHASVNLREQPNTSGRVLGTTLQGELVEVDYSAGRPDGTNTWYPVRTVNGLTGWQRVPPADFDDVEVETPPVVVEPSPDDQTPIALRSLWLTVDEIKQYIEFEQERATIIAAWRETLEKQRSHLDTLIELATSEQGVQADIVRLLEEAWRRHENTILQEENKTPAA